MRKGEFFYELVHYSNYTPEKCDEKYIKTVSFNQIKFEIENYALINNKSFLLEDWNNRVLKDKEHTFVFFHDMESIGIHRIFKEFV